MLSKSNRREFLKTTTYAGVTLWIGREASGDVKSPNEKINFACIGVGGKGSSDTADAARLGNVVAICDIDDNTLNKAAEKYPNAKKYNDFRKMLEEMGKGIDAVTVSTADHTHAPASAMAMNMGKHCFTQKPLTRTIFEARRLKEIAKQRKVATQMGNQGTARDGLRRSAALVKAGALGKVTEVHVWTNRPVWPQGEPRPQPVDPPSHVHWDLWLGPAPDRPYTETYHPFKWRGWWDFGSGALGDMACHTVNMPFMALDLRNPQWVQAETSGHNRDSFPKSSLIRFQFPETDSRPPVMMTWYDGGKVPPADLLEGKKSSGSGSLIVGDKAKLYTPGDYGENGQILGQSELPEVEFKKSPGHFEEWVNAIRGGEPAMSNFVTYSGPLTETILLGNLAVWADGTKIQWDSRALRAKNTTSEIDALIRPRYRAGWAL